MHEFLKIYRALAAFPFQLNLYINIVTKYVIILIRHASYISNNPFHSEILNQLSYQKIVLWPISHEMERITDVVIIVDFYSTQDKMICYSLVTCSPTLAVDRRSKFSSLNCCDISRGYVFRV